METLAALLAVAPEELLDGRQGDLGRLDLVDLDRLAFEIFVILEEAVVIVRLARCRQRMTWRHSTGTPTSRGSIACRPPPRAIGAFIARIVPQMKPATPT